MALVYDFPAIAKHLRRDDFFTPSPREEPQPLTGIAAYLVCHRCHQGIAPSVKRYLFCDNEFVECPNCKAPNQT